MKSYEKLLAFYKQYVIWNVYMGSFHDVDDVDLWKTLPKQFSPFVRGCWTGVSDIENYAVSLPILTFDGLKVVLSISNTYLSLRRK